MSDVGRETILLYVYSRANHVLSQYNNVMLCHCDVPVSEEFVVDMVDAHCCGVDKGSL